MPFLFTKKIVVLLICLLGSSCLYAGAFSDFFLQSSTPASQPVQTNSNDGNVPLEALVKEKFALITKGPAPVYKELNPESPILFLANRGQHFRLAGSGTSWCKIYVNEKDEIGWVEQTYISIVDDKSDTLALKDIFKYFLIVCGIGILIGILYFFLRSNNTVTEEWVPATKESHKKLLIIAKTNYSVHRDLTGGTTPIVSWLKEVGFDVITAHDGNSASAALSTDRPDAIFIDWQISANTQVSAETLLTQANLHEKAFVLFFNVPNPQTLTKSTIITKTAYLGTHLEDKVIINTLAPVFHLSEDVRHSVDKSVQSAALQGMVTSDSISEVFQFVDIGNKTGCLMIENLKNKPEGIVFFQEGLITFAACKKLVGKEALFKILNLNMGQFHFVLNKTPKNTNCTIQPIGLLMEWTQGRDENTRD